MNILIIEDNPIIGKKIENYISKILSLNHVATSSNMIEGNEIIRKYTVDLTFLDIDTSDLLTLEFLKLRGRKQYPLVILISENADFALESYEFDVVDYLLKPITFNRFKKAVSKASQHLRVKEIQLTSLEKQDMIWIKEGKKYCLISYTDIILIRAMKDYMEIILADRRIIAHITLHKLEQMLPYGQFIRVNRSCIVRISAIRSIQDLQLETALKEDTRISIGANYWENIKNLLSNII